MAYEYHQDQLRKRCRVCAQLLVSRKSTKNTVYMCSGNQRELLSAFNIDVQTDKSNVHPQYFCNTCNTKMRQYNTTSGIKSEMIVSVWEPHTEQCTLCDHFQQRGRPRKCTREHTHTIGNLNVSTIQSWGDPQPLSLSRFLPPGPGISLADLQCIVCQCVVDRPVQTSCGKLICCKCVAAHLKTPKSQLPCCEITHPPSSFTPAPDVVVKILSTLALHCSSCNSTVELKRMKEHTTSGCTQTTLLLLCYC